MYINELAEPTLLVIYPGRFQPFHKGHYAVYNWLTGKFGRNNVYIATSNKTDAVKSPFSFAEKAYFMQLTGVPADRIVQASQPYNVTNVLDSGNIQVSNPANTVVVFAVSQKDMDEDPRFTFAAKKDGSPSYYQKFTTIKQTESMDKHGYIMTVPTFDFTVLNQPMRSGTELRKLYAASDEKQRQSVIADLFGKYTREAEQIMNSKIPAETVAEAVSSFVPGRMQGDTTADGYFKLLAYRFQQNPASLNSTEKQKLHAYLLQRKLFSEDAGGVGVVRGGNDPRYMTATMGDQNAVDGNTLQKQMQAYNLIGGKAPRTGQIPVSKRIGQGNKQV